MSISKSNQRQNQLSVLPALVVALAMAAFAPALRAQEPYAIQPMAAKASAYLPQDMVNALDPLGSRVTAFSNGVEVPVAEIWWAKSVLIYDEPSASHDLLYGTLKVGEMVGVIHYLAESSEDYREDFRDQKLRPGYYTMRYAQMPQDKQHAGITPYRDFILLSPVSVDRDPQKTVSADKLLEFSRLAAHTKHPAIMSLVPAIPGSKELSGVRTDDAGTCIFQAKLHAKSARTGTPHEISLAVILVTPIEENGAS